MCSPNLLLGAQTGGAAYSAVGAYYNAQIQKTALQGQAAIDDVNAHMDELSAQSTLLAGQRAEQSSRLQTASLKSTQRNNIASNGLALDSNSAVAIQTSTDVIGDIDANTIATNAISGAFGYRTAAVNASNDALIKRAGASAISPLGAGFTSLITSAGSIATNRYLLQKYGGAAAAPKSSLSGGASTALSSSPWSFTG